MNDTIFDFDVIEEVYNIRFDNAIQIIQKINYISEKANGIVNGINKIFTTTYKYVPNTTLLYRNGILQRRGIDYFERGNKEIEIDEAPSANYFEDEIYVMYIKEE